LGIFKHKKIDTLISRVQELETALEASHSINSSDIHPLLSEDHRLVATPLDSAAAEPQRAVREELAESLGTLTLDDHGTRYFGSIGTFAVSLLQLFLLISLTRPP